MNKECIKCGNNLVIREGNKGKFLGCSTFPKCRYTEDLEGTLRDKTLFTPFKLWINKFKRQDGHPLSYSEGFWCNDVDLVFGSSKYNKYGLLEVKTHRGNLSWSQETMMDRLNKYLSSDYSYFGAYILWMSGNTPEDSEHMTLQEVNGILVWTINEQELIDFLGKFKKQEKLMESGVFLPKRYRGN